MILVVARHCLRNLFCGELAVIFRMQDFGGRTRIDGHSYGTPDFPRRHRCNGAEEAMLVPVENCEVLRRVGWELAFWPARRDWACRNSEETLAEQQRSSLLYRLSTGPFGFSTGDSFDFGPK